MTIDDLKRVREAADIVLGRFGCHRADCRDVAKYIFATIPADFDQPVTEEWLNSNFVCKLVGLIRLVVGVNGSILSFNTRTIGVSLDGRVIVNCTRYQFRLLAAALGIPKKGE